MVDLALSLSEVEFSSIKKLVFDNTGISLSASKKELVKRRFTPRLKALGLDSFDSYIAYFREHSEAENSEFCNAITTNLTSFFRENHHFEFLKDEGLPAILKRNASKQKLRIWSAGCSSGQEAYCLAMILRDSIPAVDRWDVKILATDLDEKCLATAREGLYPPDGFKSMDKALIAKYFDEEEAMNHYQKKIFYRAKADLMQMIAFKKLNLMHKWLMKGFFDIIVCRNVFIYFDKDTQTELVERYSKLQEKGSYLCLGHSETIRDPASLGYRLIGKTLYIKE